MGLSYGECDRLAKMIPNDLKITLEKALKLSPDLKRAVDADPRDGTDDPSGGTAQIEGEDGHRGHRQPGVRPGEPGRVEPANRPLPHRPRDLLDSRGWRRRGWVHHRPVLLKCLLPRPGSREPAGRFSPHSRR
ncbi:MAG: hypothetical protein HC794_00890, partial [Nitrospiraceae bacterium]|nr:hypothetical protein [Nitrospiraceae bacterium]